MSKQNNIPKSSKKQYSHLNRDTRNKIEALYNTIDKNGNRMFNNSYIASRVGVNRSTISRELRFRIKSKINIRSGRIKNKPYNAIDAHDDYLFKRAFSKGDFKLNKYPKMKEFIKNKILVDKWSPDVITGYMKKHHLFDREGFSYISYQTIYNAIRLNTIGVKIEDTRRMKYDPKYEHKSKSSVSINKLPFSIENRPDEVNSREVFGHFELDTVIGSKKGKRECLLTITERKTRFEIIFKIKGKTAYDVLSKINQIKSFLKSNYNKVFKSFTTDNGSEFSYFLDIIKDTKANIYFCHPYCSGEKGTNEKNNSIIRYFIPKKTLIESYSFDDINNIANWMNNYPRKILNYKTPLEAFLEEFNDKSIINKIYKLQESINCF